MLNHKLKNKPMSKDLHLPISLFVFPPRCEFVSHYWVDIYDVSWWLTTCSCDSLLISCSANICFWLATSHFYNASLFGTPIGCYVFPSWFNCSPCVKTFSTTCCTTSFNYFLRPFVTTLNILKNSFVLKIMGESMVLYI
jgi:hypothetical protein